MSFCCCSFWKTSKAFTVTKDIEIQQTHYLNYSKPRLGRRIAKKKHFTNIHSMLVSRCPEEVRQDCKTSWEKAGNFFEHRGITEHVRQWFWWGAPAHHCIQHSIFHIYYSFHNFAQRFLKALFWVHSWLSGYLSTACFIRDPTSMAGSRRCLSSCTTWSTTAHVLGFTCDEREFPATC